LAESDPQKQQIIGSLAGSGDAAIKPLLEAWRHDALFLYEAPGGEKIPVQLIGAKDAQDAQAAGRISDGKTLVDPAGQALRLVAGDLPAVEHNANLRRAMKAVLDLADLAAPDPAQRLQAIQTIGATQEAEKRPVLEARLNAESDANVKGAL